MGWGDLEGGFWPTGFDFSGPRPSAGQQNVQTAAARHNFAVSNDMYGGEYNDPNPYDDKFWEPGMGVGYRDENGVLRNPDGTLYQLPAEHVQIGELIGPPSVNKPPADPDFKGINIGVSPFRAFPFVNVDFSILRDRAGNWYVSPGLGIGWSPSPVTGSIITEGYAFSEGKPVSDPTAIRGVLQGTAAYGQLVTPTFDMVGGSLNMTSAGVGNYRVEFPCCGHSLIRGYGIPEIGVGRNATFHIPGTGPKR